MRYLGLREFQYVMNVVNLVISPAGVFLAMRTQLKPETQVMPLRCAGAYDQKNGRFNHGFCGKKPVPSGTRMDCCVLPAGALCT